MDEAAERERLREALRAIERNYLETLDELRVLAGSPDATATQIKHVDALLRHRLELEKAHGACPDDSLPPEEGVELFRKWQNALAVIRPSNKQPEYKELINELKTIRTRLQAAYFDLHAIPDRAALMRLADEAGERYRVAKREANRLDYDDLQHLVIRLLRERPEIRDELRGQFRVILVDEFQDTNRTQKRLLDLPAPDAHRGGRCRTSADAFSVRRRPQAVHLSLSRGGCQCFP